MSITNFKYKIDQHRLPNYVERKLEMVQWCQDNVGEYGITWGFRVWKWRFRFKKDYVTFLLRWSS